MRSARRVYRNGLSGDLTTLDMDRVLAFLDLAQRYVEHTIRADEIMILEEGAVREYGGRERLAGDPNSRFYSLLQTGLEEMLT